MMTTPLFFGSSECVSPCLLGRLESVHTNRVNARTYLVQRPCKAGRILASPSFACRPLPKSLRLLYTHPAGSVETLTNDEVHNLVTPRSSSLNVILCDPNGLSNVQTMKVNHSLLTILRQRELENDLEHVLRNIPCFSPER